jgi:hypothetical protein
MWLTRAAEVSQILSFIMLMWPMVVKTYNDLSTWRSWGFWQAKIFPLIALIVLILSTGYLHWFAMPDRKPHVFSDWAAMAQQIVPEPRTKFLNEVVTLDGKAFANCSFENVTFRFNGTAPFRIDNCTRTGMWAWDSRNGAINELLGFLQAQGFMNSEGVVRTPSENLD